MRVSEPRFCHRSTSHIRSSLSYDIITKTGMELVILMVFVVPTFQWAHAYSRWSTVSTHSPPTAPTGLVLATTMHSRYSLSVAAQCTIHSSLILLSECINRLHQM